MLNCLITLLIVVIVALIVLWIFEAIIKAIGVEPPPPILMLIRLLVAVIVLLYALGCIFEGIPIPRPVFRGAP